MDLSCKVGHGRTCSGGLWDRSAQRSCWYSFSSRRRGSREIRQRQYGFLRSHRAISKRESLPFFQGRRSSQRSVQESLWVIRRWEGKLVLIEAGQIHCHAVHHWNNTDYNHSRTLRFRELWIHDYGQYLAHDPPSIVRESRRIWFQPLTKCCL